MPVKGDFGKLDAWQRILDSGEAALEPMSQAMAEETIDLIKEGFRRAEDPYGDPWAPKQADDGRKPLHGPTGVLRTGWHVARAIGSLFAVAPKAAYAAPHQAPKRNPLTGRLRRPRRMMVPSTERGIPQDWADAYEEVALESLQQWLMSAAKRTGGGGHGARMGFVAARIAALRRRLSLRSLMRRGGSGDDEDDD